MFLRLWILPRLQNASETRECSWCWVILLRLRNIWKIQGEYFWDWGVFLGLRNIIEAEKYFWGRWILQKLSTVYWTRESSWGWESFLRLMNIPKVYGNIWCRTFSYSTEYSRYWGIFVKLGNILNGPSVRNRSEVDRHHHRYVFFSQNANLLKMASFLKRWTIWTEHIGMHVEPVAIFSVVCRPLPFMCVHFEAYLYLPIPIPVYLMPTIFTSWTYSKRHLLNETIGTIGPLSMFNMWCLLYCPCAHVQWRYTGYLLPGEYLAIWQ